LPDVPKGRECAASRKEFASRRRFAPQVAACAAEALLAESVPGGATGKSSGRDTTLR
jgi:hypothetical protein